MLDTDIQHHESEAQRQERLARLHSGPAGTTGAAAGGVGSGAAVNDPALSHGQAQPQYAQQGVTGTGYEQGGAPGFTGAQQPAVGGQGYGGAGQVPQGNATADAVRRM